MMMKLISDRPPELKQMVQCLERYYPPGPEPEGHRLDLQALSRHDDHRVVAGAGGKDKRQAVRGALAGGCMNVLITDEDLALLLEG